SSSSNNKSQEYSYLYKFDLFSIYSEEEMKALEADLLTNMYTSKLLQQDIYDPENASQDKDLMKRKTPYILKRQLHANKARRPYILKRSSYY
uniref:Neurotensin/neuromedin N n=1 Tax=Pseudonaja textilis TaxID=8673 RepID=A0A670YL79_PSETE